MLPFWASSLSSERLHCVVDPVLDIQGAGVEAAHTAAPHIALIREDQSGGYAVDRKGGAFVVVTDGGYHRRHLWRACPFIQIRKAISAPL